MNLESMYQDVILDYYRNQPHRGLREPFDAEVHHVNPTCGDEITLRVYMSDDQIEDISYEAEGCSISQAAASVLAAELTGLTVEEATQKIHAYEEMVTSRGANQGDPDVIGDGVAFAGVAQYPARVKCALLGWKALQAAMGDALAQQEGK